MISFYENEHTISLFSEEKMNEKNISTKKFYIFLAAFFTILVVISRLSSYFYSFTYTDITFPDWVPTFFHTISLVSVCAELALSFAAISYSSFNLPSPHSLITFILTSAFSLADSMTKLLIDCLTNSLDEYGMLALVYILLQFAYRFVLLILSLLISRAFILKRKSMASEKSAKYSEKRAAGFSVLLLFATQLASEVSYLIKFLNTYSDITSAETLSIIGSFIRLITVYGIAAMIISLSFISFFGKSCEKK